MIRLRYFAGLREALGVADEQLELPAGIEDVAGLSRWLRERGGEWDSALADRQLHVAVNQVVTGPAAVIRDGDEVAWFPPVTGG
jgi:molybdopterin synthase sulfur carrier subunit